MGNDLVRQKVNEAAVRGDNDQPTVFDLINAQLPEIRKALPDEKDPERFKRVAFTLVKSTPLLGECERYSFLGALMVAAQLGLEPGAPMGQCWIVPRRNRKQGGRWEAHFQWGYKGIIELFRRSGQYKSIQARAVKANDFFSYSYGVGTGDDDEHLIHKPAMKGPRGDSYLWYAIAKFRDGGHAFIVLNREEVEARRNRGDNGPAWRTDYDAMAAKSCVMALAPWLPLSPELERQLAADNRVFTKVSANMIEDLPALEAGEDMGGGEPEDQDDPSPSAPSDEVAKPEVEPDPPVEDATGDVAEVEPSGTEWGTEHTWTPDQWKTFLKEHGVTQADAIRRADEFATEFSLDRAGGLAGLAGKAELCRLLRGWAEEQKA